MSLMAPTVPETPKIRQIIAESLSVAAAFFLVSTMLVICITDPSVNYWCPNGDVFVVPFVNMRSLYEVICHEIFNLIKYSRAYLVYENFYGIKHIISVVYLGFQAFVVLYTIDTLGTKAVEFITVSNSQNYVSVGSEQQSNISWSHLGSYTVYANGIKDENISGTVDSLDAGYRDFSVRATPST